MVENGARGPIFDSTAHRQGRRTGAAEAFLLRASATAPLEDFHVYSVKIDGVQCYRAAYGVYPNPEQTVQQCYSFRHCSQPRNRITDPSSACGVRTGNNARWTSQINMLEYKLALTTPKHKGAQVFFMATRASYVIWLGLFIGACAQAPMKQSEGHVQPDGAAPAGTIPAPVQISTVLPKPRPALKPETYSVVVNNVNVQELLFALARDAKLNVDINQGIRGVVTLNAIDQTLPQLLSRIARQVDMRWNWTAQPLGNAGFALLAGVQGRLPEHGALDHRNGRRLVADLERGGRKWRWRRRGEQQHFSTTVQSRSSNKFWETLVENIKDILRETDRALPAGQAATVPPRRRPLLPQQVHLRNRTTGRLPRGGTGSRQLPRSRVGHLQFRSGRPQHSRHLAPARENTGVPRPGAIQRQAAGAH